LERRKDGLTESRGRAMLVCLSTMFTWLLQNRRVEVNPCRDVVRPKPPQARVRVLDQDEIRAFWAACGKLNAPFGAILKLLLLTGCRLNEIASLRWDELAEDEIRLPGTRTKNHKPHTVPLGALAREVITSVQRFPGSPFVFTTTGITPVSGWSKAKNRI